ncbi:MAG TPA: hypothetical protein VMU39_30545 [Solirubrobacteraceae bacterium]|nr:hypothetical protein [Solirubrobacteraceae bacterium]
MHLDGQRDRTCGIDRDNRGWTTRAPTAAVRLSRAHEPKLLQLADELPDRSSAQPQIVGQIRAGDAATLMNEL